MANTALLKKIRLLSLDVDGVLTDGGLYYIEGGAVMRKFNAKDGMGIAQLIKNTDVKVTIISSGMPSGIMERAERLGIEYAYTNVANKLDTLTELANDLDIDLSQIAHMGDDTNDLQLMQHVGLGIAVNDAVDEVLKVADMTTTKNGGYGAVREICDQLLQIHKQD